MSNDRLSWPSTAPSFTDQLIQRLDALAEGDQLLLVFADRDSVDIQHASRSYSIRLDTNYDLSFATDISDMVDAIDWHLGMYEPEEVMAPPLQARLTLSDPDGVFSRDRAQATNNPLGGELIGMLVQVTATVLGQEFVLVTGWINDIRPSEHVYGYITQIEFTDKMTELQAYEYTPQIRQQVSVSDEIRNVFHEISVTYPYERSFWIIGASLLGTETILNSPDLDVSESARFLRWTGVGVDRGDGISAYGYIQDLVSAELGGRFFVNREGKFAFHDRHRDLIADVAATIDTSQVDTYDYGQSAVFNQVTVRYYPRDIGAPGSVLARIVAEGEAPITVDPGEVYEVTGTFRDPDNPDAAVGGMDILPVEADRDYRTSRNREYRLEDISNEVAVRVRHSGVDTKFEVENFTDEPQYIHRLQVRGTPILAYSSEMALRSDPESIKQYGLKEFPYADLRFVDREDVAELFATTALYRTAAQRSDYRELDFDIGDELGSRDQLATVLLSLEIGAVIRFQNAVTNHDALYAIVGEEHRIQGVVHYIRWILRRVHTQVVWILEEAELGVDTIPSF